MEFPNHVIVNIKYSYCKTDRILADDDPQSSVFRLKPPTGINQTSHHFPTLGLVDFQSPSWRTGI